MGPIDVPVVERLELGLGRVGAGQDVAEQVARLVDAAQDGVLAGEDLHRDERVEALLLEDALGTREIDVSRVARQDLVRRPRARQTHQSGSAPLAPSSPTSTGPAGSEEAASVAYGSGGRGCLEAGPGRRGQASRRESGSRRGAARAARPRG